MTQAPNPARVTGCARTKHLQPQEKVWDIMSTKKYMGAALALALAAAASPASAATLTTAFAFDGAAGAVPNNGNLLITSGTVYAATNAGGDNDLGAIVSLPTSGATAPTLLHSFAGPDGESPNGSLVADTSGNLYGTTQGGGANGLGSVFKLTNPHSTGAAWPVTTIHSFTCQDGAYPKAGATLGPDGSLYGTTYGQGAGCAAPNYGAVWKLSGGTFRIMHAFTGSAFPSPTHPAQPDGGNPSSNIVLDPSGIMIGTASLGIPNNGAGSLFAISPTGNYTQVAAFSHYYGTGPIGNIVRDSAGNVYGTIPTSTGYMQPSIGAIVFKVTAGTHQIVNLAYIPGQFSESGVILDRAGNLYGTVTGYQYKDPNWQETIGSSVRSGGGVFSVSPSGALTNLASLSFDNQGPVGGVVFDAAGNLWGTSSAGGLRCASNPSTSGCGTIFELTP
jgi:uncharacterized repeat protein (TIGR03803 family)